MRSRAVVVTVQGGLVPLAGEVPVGRQARPCQAGPRRAVEIIPHFASFAAPAARANLEKGGHDKPFTHRRSRS